MTFCLCLLLLAPLAYWGWRVFSRASASALTTLLDWPQTNRSNFGEGERQP